MGDFATTTAILFLILVAVGTLVFVLAWSAGRIARLRYERDVASGRARRSWGGRDHDRVRTKYFNKERRARAVRDRTRGAAPPPPRDTGSARPVTDLEYAHRETLGLVGVEITPYRLREAYKQRVREYHPDRVVALGVKLRLLAEEETKRINAAYRYLRRQLDEERL